MITTLKEIGIIDLVFGKEYVMSFPLFFLMGIGVLGILFGIGFIISRMITDTVSNEVTKQLKGKKAQKSTRA